MALTPEDRAFYQSKLGYKGFIYLFVATVATGAIAWPVLLYLQDSSNGMASHWTLRIAINVAISGMLAGMAISVLMFFFVHFCLWLGWLPRRH